MLGPEFYAGEFEDRLRFGDVVQDLPSAHVELADPPVTPAVEAGMTIELLTTPSVVLTPCCEIGKTKYLTLVPLTKIGPYVNLFKNENFRSDPLRLNTRVPPERCLPSAQWEGLSDEEREKRLSKGDVYAFTYLYVYPNKPPILEDYNLEGDVGNGREVLPGGWYIIDFRDSFRLSISSKEKHRAFVSCKKLQLSLASRDLLRHKLSQFYGEPPAEDLALIATSGAQTV